MQYVYIIGTSAFFLYIYIQDIIVDVGENMGIFVVIRGEMEYESIKT